MRRPCPISAHVTSFCFLRRNPLAPFYLNNGKNILPFKLNLAYLAVIQDGIYHVTRIRVFPNIKVFLHVFSFPKSYFNKTQISVNVKRLPKISISQFLKYPLADREPVFVFRESVCYSHLEAVRRVIMLILS